MHDDVESSLRRYRPVGPPEDLRDRFVTAARSLRIRRWEWFPAAVVAGVAALLYTLAAGVRTDLLAAAAPKDEAREATLRELVATFGDGPRARDEAEWLLFLDQQSLEEDRGSLTKSESEGERP